MDLQITATVLRKTKRGSDPHNITLDVERNKLTLWCDCKASENGLFCCHKMMAAKGDTSACIDDDQKSNLLKISGFIKRSGLLQFFEEVEEIDRKLFVLKRQKKMKTFEIAELMKKGVRFKASRSQSKNLEIGVYDQHRT